MREKNLAKYTYMPATSYEIRYADDAFVEIAYQFICFVYHSQNWLKFVYDGFTPVICLTGWFIWCLRESFLPIFYLPLFHKLVL